MFCQVKDGEVVQVIPRPVPITINDIQYPKQIFQKWSNAELKAIDLLPYLENTVDSRFYHRGELSYEVKSDEVIGTYAQTALDNDDIKNRMIEQVKRQASRLLESTDWMAWREGEGGTAIPDDVKTYRTAIRKESNDKEIEIKALSNLDAIKLYHATPHILTMKNKDDENYTTETDVNLVQHYFTSDPLNVDPDFVSLVKK
tara:strand:+ start:1148 stop:1750 length:603 start_codon:yes stop_codon:yes gene_type:complete